MKKTLNKNSKTDRKYVNILGVNILSTTTASVLTASLYNISHSQTGAHNIKFSILTPNPELVLASTTNNKLKEALNSATFSIPDGLGLLAADSYQQSLIGISNNYGYIQSFRAWFESFYINTFDRQKLQSKLNLIKGRSLFLKLVELAEKKGWKVFLLGGEGNEAVFCAEHLISVYPNILLSTSRGPILDKNGEPNSKIDIKVQSDLIKRINMLKPDLLFVAFGNPKQELWIHNNLSKLNIGGAMAVGGTFRYIAGLSKLPPKWMEKLGLEWLWRLVTEPNRFIRIWNAVILFPLKVFLTKYNK